MSSGQQIPPWLQEQLAKMQQSQQNLQSILAQKQHLELEQLETEKALEEITKASDDTIVYKHAGSILIKSNKNDLIAELEEKKELAKTRVTVLSKQEQRVKENLKEQESKINEMIRSETSSYSNIQQPSKTDSSK
jgi:prefoldin beta subunit